MGPGVLTRDRRASVAIAREAIVRFDPAQIGRRDRILSGPTGRQQIVRSGRAKSARSSRPVSDSRGVKIDPASQPIGLSNRRLSAASSPGRIVRFDRRVAGIGRSAAAAIDHSGRRGAAVHHQAPLVDSIASGVEVGRVEAVIFAAVIADPAVAAASVEVAARRAEAAVAAVVSVDRPRRPVRTTF
jgi:hypothetical protein